MTSQPDEAKWEEIAVANAARVDGTLAYYRREIRWCRFWDRWLSVAVLVLGVVTPILVTLTTTRDFSATSVTNLQILSILTSGTLALLEGARKIFLFDKRWATAYLTMLSLQRARAQYKADRIGLPTGSQEWKKRFICYQNVFHDLIAKETQDFFKDLAPER